MKINKFNVVTKILFTIFICYNIFVSSLSVCFLDYIQSYCVILESEKTIATPVFKVTFKNDVSLRFVEGNTVKINKTNTKYFKHS